MRIEKGRFWTRYDKVQQAEPTEAVSNLEGSLHAVLFNAGENPAFSSDISIIHSCLVEVGIPNTDISVLEGRPGNYFVDKPATRTNLESAIEAIRKRATPNDRLLVCIIGHGNKVKGQGTVKTYDGVLWENDFAQMMQDLSVNFGLFYFGQCYSGGFAERMGYGRNIGMSSTSQNRLSYASQRGWLGGCFIQAIFPTILRGVTIEKAFDTAVYKDTNLRDRYNRIMDPEYPLFMRRETPQLRWQNADPSKLYLGSASLLKK